MTTSDDRATPLPPGAGPLAGIRVLDFSRVLTGPHCGRMLADLGADVVKVEPPDGDIIRFAAPRRNSMSTYFTQQNTGKRNISIDMSDPRGVQVAKRLASAVDVVLENFRPGVMDRLGIGYEALSALHPRLVYATITGYGQDGAWAGRPAYAATIHAEMGMMDILSRTRGTPPAHDPFSHGDLYASLECLSGILAALFWRERTGRGQRVDVSMAQTLLCINEHAHAEIDGHPGSPSGSALTRSPVLRMKDGRHVTISADVTLRGAFGQICQAMDTPDLGADPRFADDAARRTNRDALLDIIGTWASGFETVEQLEAALEKGRLALGVIRSTREAATSDWAVATGAVVGVSDRGEGTIPVPQSPWTFSETPTGVRGEPAYRGEHNRQVLVELGGYTDGEVDELEAAGVLSHRGPSSTQ